MFKRRAIQVKMVKTNDNDEQIECDHLDPEKINAMIKDQVKHAAIAAVTVVAVSAVLHTVSEILINAAKPKER